MSRRDRITAVLTDRFAPAALEVRDVSARHYGHSGWREGGETHIEVDIRSSALTGMSKIEAHRAVNDALAAEFDGGLHALQISILQ